MKFQHLVIALLVATIIGNFYFLHLMVDNQREEIRLQQRVHEEHGHVSRGEHDVHEHVAVNVAKTIQVEAYSSRLQVTIKVSGKTVYNKEYKEGEEAGRGIHVAVLHGETGALLTTSVFDTYASDVEFNAYLEQVTAGRLLVLTIRDEGTFSLKGEAKAKLVRLGSEHASALHWRDTWSMVVKVGAPDTAKDVRGVSKALDVWGAPVTVRAEFDAENTADCLWDDARRHFCDQYDGYGDVCSCVSPLALPTGGLPLPELQDVPVAIIASQNRPRYLFRMLTKLLSIKGASASMIRVYIDGLDKPEALDLTRLLGVKGIRQEPKSERNARISQHYLAALTAVFEEFQTAAHVLILEEDLEVAPDFFHYFAQTRPLLEADPTLYCVSAWNDLGYKHTAKDPTMLMRLDTMPGLGWMLKRDLFVDELRAKWPSADKFWDWDMWMRMNEQRKGRECIVPDISRTFHFGAHGVNMNDYFQDLYFNKHLLSTVPFAELKTKEMEASRYEEHLNGLLAASVPIDTAKVDVCNYGNAIPKSQSQYHVIYMRQTKPHDYETWTTLATCFKIWDLDARGFHKALWRLWLNDTPIMVIGSSSPFYSHKPDGLEPYFKPKVHDKAKA
eukprot:m.96341 g.96341  ORF g.96341 m.96341 type:complete len:615 (+) comp15048_c0_seq2:189-2033(+)